jgi:hypothetical protein
MTSSRPNPDERRRCATFFSAPRSLCSRGSGQIVIPPGEKGIVLDAKAALRRRPGKLTAEKLCREEPILRSVYLELREQLVLRRSPRRRDLVDEDREWVLARHSRGNVKLPVFFYRRGSLGALKGHPGEKRLRRIGQNRRSSPLPAFRAPGINESMAKQRQAQPQPPSS